MGVSCQNATLQRGGISSNVTSRRIGRWGSKWQFFRYVLFELSHSFRLNSIKSQQKIMYFCKEVCNRNAIANKIRLFPTSI